MSEHNVETVRRVYEAWNRDDPEAALVVMHPDVELRNPTDVFLGTQSVYRGHAGLREFWMAAKEPWAYFKSHIERTLVKDDKVVTLVRFEAVGRESGAKVGLSFANVWELRDGLIAKFGAYNSLEEALHAAGISEQDAHEHSS
jgi:ketosteroid isomerase-like protein